MSKTGREIVKCEEGQKGFYDLEDCNDLSENEKLELNEIYTQQEQENAKHQ